MSDKVRIAELKSRLSEYLRRVRRGHRITVLDRDTPIARLVATGQSVGGSCPNVTVQEWDLGQQAIGLTGATEEGFLIQANGSVQRADGPDWVKTGRSLGPKVQWPPNSSTFVHSHPSGKGISPDDVNLANGTGIRIVSAGVGTNRYGSASQGGTPVSCNTPVSP